MGNRLYVGNLSYDSTADGLRQTFSEFGMVTDAHVVIDRESGRSRGFGFVTMSSPQEARTAMEKMNGAVFEGRPLKVNEAEERPSRNGGGRGFGGGRHGGRRGDHRDW
jgi:RNA recognition motif-containing protein